LASECSRKAFSKRNVDVDGPGSSEFGIRVSMFVQPIDYLLVIWFALAAISTIYVAWDQFTTNPEPTVMKWGFILVTLYMGPYWPAALCAG